MNRNPLAYAVLLAAVLTSAGCRKETGPKTEAPPPSILLVTLDTTRADAIGPEAVGIETPSFNALAVKGRRFRWAYAAVPQTLPSHTSMLTGLYPAGHGLHENGRYLSPTQPLIAERLHAAGYRTAAFVSAFALARRFGLARGFDAYDDDQPAGRAERTAKETTERVMAFLGKPAKQPLFLWVHYYDPHFPYEPPEPFRTRFSSKPYLGEVAAMDQQLGRLVAAFRQRFGADAAIIVVGDHGEGLGDHGEAQHGNLLYQSTIHVPLLISGPGVAAGASDTPVSTRRIFHTILDWAGIDPTNSLRRSDAEVVAAEAMKPFLDYGWQPQVMAVEGRYKAILAGRVEVYDVVADPAETHDLAAQLTRSMRTTLREYPVPSLDAATVAEPPNVSEEERRKLASLGYVASSTKAVVRPNAPRPVDMAHLFPVEDQAAALFVRDQYAEAVPLLTRILSEDPYNLDAALRLGTCYSMLGRDREALATYQQAQTIAPQSQDVRQYLGLHYARGSEWQRAIPLVWPLSKGWRSSVDGKAVSTTKSRCFKRSTRSVHRRRRSCCDSAGWRCSAGRQRRRPTHSRKRAPCREAPLAMTSSSACSISTPIASTRPAQHSIAFRPRIRATPWRSSNGLRSASCCTSPTHRHASRRPVRMAIR
jgi:arylsulfatase A-like enzyme